MGYDITLLWRAPEVSPINKKAKSVPLLNPINPYGRVFFFSWVGFMIAFWAWYTFPPLLTKTIKTDLDLTTAQVGNSNICSLAATLLIRCISGPLCDQFGPRWVFAGLLLIGCLPVGLAPLVTSATGLYVSRFFIGVLGGTFVPCQVWCTGFFDKNVVGTANAFAGGWGNAGGGVTYFIMPAVFDSLVANQGMSDSEAWRVTFVVPLICLIACGISLLLLCPDSPVGKWSERSQRIQENLEIHGVQDTGVVDVPGVITDAPSKEEEQALDSVEKKHDAKDPDAEPSKSEALETAKGETVVKPSFKEALPVVFSLQTAFHVCSYGCSFGAELAINSILSSYYIKNFPSLGQTAASNYAAIFALLNFGTRPLGGLISDALYTRFGHNLWLKKGWIGLCGVLAGAMLIIIGQVDPSVENGSSVSTLAGLIALMAIFLEAGNGANYALVPHVHPFANGIVSGITGGGGNFGGIIFSIIFRFIGGGDDYAKSFWIIGVIHIAMNLLICWIPPLPKGQVGGH